MLSWWSWSHGAPAALVQGRRPLAADTPVAARRLLHRLDAELVRGLNGREASQANPPGTGALVAAPHRVHRGRLGRRRRGRGRGCVTFAHLASPVVRPRAT